VSWSTPPTCTPSTLKAVFHLPHAKASSSYYWSNSSSSLQPSHTCSSPLFLMLKRRVTSLRSCSLTLTFNGAFRPPCALPGFWIFMYRISPLTCKYSLTPYFLRSITETNTTNQTSSQQSPLPASPAAT
jgi:hypothetical protein